MITDNSLKEYYIKIQGLYNNAVNILTAINQSLISTSSEVTVKITDSNNVNTTYRIPSFLYLENKLEQLNTNFGNLFNISDSGEAWFTQTENMYKLNFIRSGIAPVIPNIETSNTFASLTDNNILKDMVSPKTYLKINISNLPDNISQIYMKKIVFHSDTIFDSLKSLNLKSYNEYKAALYRYSKGNEYEEYDSVLDLPIKTDTYKSIFKITEILDSYYEETTKKNRYELRLNTLVYEDFEDSSIEYTLQPNKRICIPSENVIYKVINTNTENQTIILEEEIGHISLQTTEENESIYLSLYVSDYSNFHYIQIPLEENRYICVFIGTIYNNTRSILSDPYLVDLRDIKMYDANGQSILDDYGNHYNYIDYYNKYCMNIGDLILALTKTAYPQVTNYSNTVLSNLQTSTIIKNLVNNTFEGESIIKVVPINKHLTDDTTNEEIINLHNQKNELNSQLSSIQANIDQTYNTLISTDFTQDTSVTQLSLQSKLTEFYTERTELQKQIIAVVDNINTNVNGASLNNTKYRVRGVTVIDNLETYLHETLADEKLTVIGLEVEYKYKSVSKDTTSVTTINSNVFTDWNRLNNIDRQRYLKFNSTLNGYTIEYVNYDSTTNIIKWNQIDIPINVGEDVVIRIRYKYNVGQPFINIYSPWSDELVVEFPNEYIENVEVSDIISNNEDDTISAKFNKTLINEGYQEHITHNLVINNQTFYHMPENIYSGFNTAENNYISLKDKLTSMVNDIEKYSSILSTASDAKYNVYLVYDTKTIKLFDKTLNKINIYNSDHIHNAFIRKDMSIVIKNTGEVPVKLYSIFPGAIDTPLLLCTNAYYEKTISDYERVPLIVDDTVMCQTLGQYIYFRQNNPYTSADIYYNSSIQNQKDIDLLASASASENSIFDGSPNDYMNKNNKQMLLGYRQRTGTATQSVSNYWCTLDFTNDNKNPIITKRTADTSLRDSIYKQYENVSLDWFMYKNLTNNFILRFEDIFAINSLGEVVNIDNTTSLSDFIANYNNMYYFSESESNFNGGFFYPNISGRTTILTNGSENDFCEIAVGDSISIPITFEYYLDGANLKEITKSLYFDLKDSIIKEPVHFMLQVTASYDYSTTGDLLNMTQLIDDASDKK